MPAARAYTPEEVIAIGLAVEASATVTARSLHQALGGKGDPHTAFLTWERFVSHRDRLGIVPVNARQDDVPGPANAVLQQMQALGIELAKIVREETAATYERRAGHHVRQVDDLLARNEAQAKEIVFLRRLLPALPAPEN